MRPEEAEWREEAKKRRYKILGEFRNKHGELFIVYKILQNLKLYFVTGDEFNWSEDYNYLKGMVVSVFCATKDELDNIKNIVKKAEDSNA